MTDIKRNAEEDLCLCEENASNDGAYHAMRRIADYWIRRAVESEAEIERLKGIIAHGEDSITRILRQLEEARNVNGWWKVADDRLEEIKRLNDEVAALRSSKSFLREKFKAKRKWYLEMMRKEYEGRKDAIIAGNDFIDWCDLMVDEFKRIKSCPGCTSEIAGLCDRAITNTKQHVPVIEQRDELMEALRISMIRAYAIGYEHGHHETVEGIFVPVSHADASTYFNDVVENMIEDGSLPEAATILVK